MFRYLIPAVHFFVRQLAKREISCRKNSHVRYVIVFINRINVYAINLNSHFHSASGVKKAQQRKAVNLGLKLKSDKVEFAYEN